MHRNANDDAWRFRARLAPVEGGDRPLWSVMIPTFNSARYLEQTLGSVLAQAPGPEIMQIEVVDDASDRDDPEAVVAMLGKGRVGFHRQPRNVGHSANFRTCLERARGRYIHLLHGDDAVVDGFYRQLGAGLDRCPQAGAAFCRQIYIDTQGKPIWTSELERATSGLLENWLERIAVRQLIQTPSIVVRREVYERLGLFDRRLTWSEDWEMWCRIAAEYPVWYEPEPLALYRVHGSSSTGRKIRTGENLRDVRRAVDLVSSYLPTTSAPRIRRKSLQHWAADALDVRAPILLRQADYSGAAWQIFEALRCNRSPSTLRRLARLVATSGRELVPSWRTRLRSAKPALRGRHAEPGDDPRGEETSRW